MTKSQPISESATDTTFATVRQSFEGHPHLKPSLAQANVILLPMFDSERNGEPVFGTNVRDVYQALAKRADDGVFVELAYDGDSPPKLVLHGDLFVFGTLLVTHVVLPIVVGVLSSIIYDRVRSRSRKLDETEVRCTFVIEEADGTARRLDYNGPASSFERLVNNRTLPAPVDRSVIKDDD